jgi:predicted XRE-type DNA-binding protein
MSSVICSSDNIFADLGLSDAEECMLKAKIALYLARRIKQRALTRRKAAKRMGVGQRELSNVLHGRLEQFSVDQLLGCARRLERRHTLEELLTDFDPDAHRAEMEAWDSMPPAGREFW